MADRTILQLPELSSGLDLNNDFVPIWDKSAATTKRMVLGKAMPTWLNVKHYGATGDGSTDDTTAIQDTIDVAEAADGAVVFFPPGDYKISSTLTVGNGTETTLSDQHNVRLIGEGWGATGADISGDEQVSQLLWYGAASGIMVSIRGPISACSVENLHFDCRDVADTGLEVLHAFGSVFRNLVVERYQGAAYTIRSRNDTIAGLVRGADDNTWDTVRAIDPAGTNAIGLIAGDSGPSATVAIGTSRNTWTNCCFTRGSGASGKSLVLRFIDSCVFTGCTFWSGGTGYSLYVDPPANRQDYPNQVSFVGCSLLGPKAVNGTWTQVNHGITFWSMWTGDDSTLPDHYNFRGFTDKITYFENGVEGRVLNTEASAYHNTTQTIDDDGSYHALAFNAEISDDEGWHDPATNNSRMTVLQDGIYMGVVQNLEWDSDTTGTRDVIIKQSTGAVWNGSLLPASASLRQPLTGVRAMSAGDYVEVQAKQNSGGTRTLSSSVKFTLIKIK